MLRIFTLFCFLLLPFQALAKESIKNIDKEAISTNQIIGQIEKSLLFDKEARQKIDVYDRYKKSNKSTDIVDSGNVDVNNSGADIDIVVINPKSGAFSLREKEKLAYNAALISQYEVAIELYKKVIAGEPNNKYAKFALAVTYQKIGQLKQAKNIYYDLLKDNPENPEEIVENLLSVLVEESPKEATYVLSRLALQNPSSPEILAQAALAYEKINDYNKAITLLKDASMLSPERVDYKYNLAVIYDKAEKYDDALSLYNEVVKDYSPDYKSVALDDVRNRIEFLKNKV